MIHHLITYSYVISRGDGRVLTDLYDLNIWWNLNMLRDAQRLREERLYKPPRMEQGRVVPAVENIQQHKERQAIEDRAGRQLDIFDDVARVEQYQALRSRQRDWPGAKIA